MSKKKSNDYLLTVQHMQVQIFTHNDVSTTPVTVRHFNATDMYRAALDAVKSDDAKSHGTALRALGVEVLRIAVDPAWVTMMRKARDVNAAHVASLRFSASDVPAIGALMADGTTLTVDGHHRIAKSAERGETTYYMLRYRLGAWERFLIDLPDEIAQAALADIAATTISVRCPRCNSDNLTAASEGGRAECRACGHECAITELRQ